MINAVNDTMMGAMGGKTDAALLDAWRSGDSEAGERLFERYVSAVTRFFRNKVSIGIEDLVQETFLGLVEGRERLRKASTTRSYLFAIAHNVLRAHLRKLGRERAIDDGVSSIAELVPNMSSVVGRQREHRLLLDALRRLPLRDQIVLELSFWEGLSAVEIAEIVGGTASAMRGRVFRARKQLEQELAELASSPPVLRSTLSGFAGWVAEIREELAKPVP